jgi:ubiquinone/menaquinone biosynthesis C-methylase UbiE
VLREMARVARPGGLIVIVDSLQKGDHPDWDGLLDLFPHYFHEPYYAEYVNGSLAAWAGEAGLVETEAERAFLSRITVLRPL